MTNNQRVLVEESARYVFELFQDKLSPNYVFHNYQHTIETVTTCKTLAHAYSEISMEDLEVLLLAAWFLNSGYTISFENHEEKSKEIARAFLNEKNYDINRIEEVLRCIDSTKNVSKPSDLLCKIIADANHAYIGQDTYQAKAELLRTELSRFGKTFMNDKEWITAQIEFIQSTNFHTEEAKLLFEAQRNKTLKKLYKKLKKIDKKEDKKQDHSKDARWGIQTMFRSIYRSHINLSSIADNKANMMIRVNSMIISVALTLVGAKFSFMGTSFKQNLIIIYPIMSLLLTGLVTIIFAILAAKPRITHKVHDAEDIQNKKGSILFFGNYSSVKLDEFKGGMKEMIKDRDTIYDNMMTDLYCLGKVLTRKYYLINISYLIFMTGLIMTGLITVYVVFHLKNEGPFLYRSE